MAALAAMVVALQASVLFRCFYKEFATGHVIIRAHIRERTS
jgi:hypothetical protein